MTFRASNQVKADGYSEAKRLAARAKSFAQSHHDAMAANSVSANLLLQLLNELKSLIERWTEIAATPGIGAYAQDQENDPAYNVATEFTAMLNAARAARDRIIADLPKAPGGEIAIHTLAADGATSTRAFTPAQTANLRTDLAAFIATIV